MWRKRFCFLFFAIMWFLSLGDKIKIEVFLGGAFLKKVGTFKNPQDISGAAGAFAPPGAGPESSAGAKAPPGAGSEF